MFKKFKTKYNDYQLVLYKHALSSMENIPLDKIKLCFLTVAKDLSISKPLSLLEITSGNVKVNNALDWMNKVLTEVNKKKFARNRKACNTAFYGKECPFLRSHCS